MKELKGMEEISDSSSTKQAPKAYEDQFREYEKIIRQKINNEERLKIHCINTEECLEDLKSLYENLNEKHKAILMSVAEMEVNLE